MSTALVHFDGVKLRRCSRCKQYKHIKCFGPNRVKPRGLDGYCIDCRREYGNANARKRRAVNKDYFRDYDLRKRFGITLSEYEVMYAEQDGVCAICENTVDRLAVDHCHKTGVIRGLLCGPCNRGLACFRDDPSRLLAAVEYLR